MKRTVRWEQPTILFTKKLYDLSKLFYKIEMSFAEFQHKLGGPDKCLKCQKA